MGPRFCSLRSFLSLFIKHCQSDKTAALGYSGRRCPPPSLGDFSISCADPFSKEITSGSLDRISWNSHPGSES